jgi:hypothetical protein
VFHAATWQHTSTACASQHGAELPSAVAVQGLSSAGLDGVLLGGNYVAGVALGKCVEYGFEFANQISSHVSKQVPAKEKVTA